MFDILWHKILKRPYRLHVAHDAGKGQPVVLLHGIATDSSSWHRMIPLVPTDQYRVIAIDLLGFGRSPKPQWSSYSTNDHSASIVYTLQKMRLKMPIILVGHSMGSLIATHIAAGQQLTLKQLVLCSMPIYVKGELSQAADSYARAKRSRDNVYFRLYNALRQRPELTLRTARQVMRLGGSSMGFVLTKSTWVSFKNSLQNTIETQDALNDLKQVTVPIDILYGNLDLFVQGKYFRKLARQAPSIRIYRFIAGHELSRPYVRKIAEIITDQAVLKKSTSATSGGKKPSSGRKSAAHS